MDLGVNYDDNRQGFYVPRYVIEGDAERGIAPMAPDLKSVKDLSRYAALFKDEEDLAKGRLYGAIPGWNIDAILYKKYEVYGLNQNYIYFRPGSEATLSTAFLTATRKGFLLLGINGNLLGFPVNLTLYCWKTPLMRRPPLKRALRKPLP